MAINKTQFRSELLATNNLAELLKVWDKYFDLKGTEIGAVTKTMIVNKLDTLINVTRAKERDKN